jgi:hypothetical protein
MACPRCGAAAPPATACFDCAALTECVERADALLQAVDDAPSARALEADNDRLAPGWRRHASEALARAQLPVKAGGAAVAGIVWVLCRWLDHPEDHAERRIAAHVLHEPVGSVAELRQRLHVIRDYALEALERRAEMKASHAPKHSVVLETQARHLRRLEEARKLMSGL